jgi:predicted nucleic acid-binding protein
MVYLETEAKLFIQGMIENKKINLAWSYMLDYENEANPDEDVKNAIAGWKRVVRHSAIATKTIIAEANILHGQGFGVKDSLHIAASKSLACDYFITVDRDILKLRKKIAGILIVNPIEFIERLEDSL